MHGVLLLHTLTAHSSRIDMYLNLWKMKIILKEDGDESEKEKGQVGGIRVGAKIVCTSANLIKVKIMWTAAQTLKNEQIMCDVEYGRSLLCCCWKEFGERKREGENFSFSSILTYGNQINIQCASYYRLQRHHIVTAKSQKNHTS